LNTLNIFRFRIWTFIYPSPNSFHQFENETKMDTAQYFKLVVKSLVKPRITGWPPCTFRPFVSDKWRTPGIRVPFSPSKYPFNFSCCCWPDAPAFGQTFGADTFIGLVAKMQAKAFFLFHFFFCGPFCQKLLCLVEDASVLMNDERRGHWK